MPWITKHTHMLADTSCFAEGCMSTQFLTSRAQCQVVCVEHRHPLVRKLALVDQCRLMHMKHMHAPKKCASWLHTRMYFERIQIDWPGQEDACYEQACVRAWCFTHTHVRSQVAKIHALGQIAKLDSCRYASHSSFAPCPASAHSISTQHHYCALGA